MDLDRAFAFMFTSVVTNVFHLRFERRPDAAALPAAAMAAAVQVRDARGCGIFHGVHTDVHGGDLLAIGSRRGAQLRVRKPVTRVRGAFVYGDEDAAWRAHARHFPPAPEPTPFSFGSPSPTPAPPPTVPPTPAPTFVHWPATPPDYGGSVTLSLADTDADVPRNLARFPVVAVGGYQHDSMPLGLVVDAAFTAAPSNSTCDVLMRHYGDVRGAVLPLVPGCPWAPVACDAPKGSSGAGMDEERFAAACTSAGAYARGAAANGGGGTCWTSRVLPCGIGGTCRADAASLASSGGADDGVRFVCDCESDYTGRLCDHQLFDDTPRVAVPSSVGDSPVAPSPPHQLAFVPAIGGIVGVGAAILLIVVVACCFVNTRVRRGTEYVR